MLSGEETIEMLQSCTSGVLAVAGDNDYPYAVPLSYAYKDGKIFFHCAKTGHKIDSIKRNNKVSFCVIASDVVVPQTFNTLYRSAIAFGRARILEEDGERRAALECIIEKYSPGFEKEAQAMIAEEWEHVCLVEIDIVHMTGKAASELI